jgi:hypothetical protein
MTLQDQIVQTLFALITTVIGGVLGFSLSEVSTRRREAREEKRRAEGVRVIIRMEIDRNLAALKTFWAAVKASDRDDLGRRRKNVLAEQFVQVSLTPFSRDSLTSQMGMLAASLSSVQIERVFHLYDRLDSLMTKRAALAEALRDEQQEMTRFRQSQSAPGQPQGLLYGPRTPFDTSANRDWDEIEATAAELLEAGNPLQPPTNNASSATKPLSNTETLG